MSNRLQRFLTEDFNVNVKIQPEKEIEIDAKGDDIDEVEEFARCVLGDNCDFFGQSFDNEEDEIEEISDSEKLTEDVKYTTDELKSDLEAALHTPGVWGVEEVGDYCNVFATEKEARAYFNSLDLADIDADCDGIELFVVLDNAGNTDVVDYKSKYEEVDEAFNDNAVKDCKNYKLVAHCKEEKPVCNIEKPVLPDELTDPDLDMTDEEFYLAFGKAMKEKKEALTEDGLLSKIKTAMGDANTIMDKMFKSYTIKAQDKDGKIVKTADNVGTYKDAVLQAKSLAAQHGKASIITKDVSSDFKDVQLSNKPIIGRVLDVEYDNRRPDDYTRSMIDLYKKVAKDPAHKMTGKQQTEAPEETQGQPQEQTPAKEAPAETSTAQAPTKEAPADAAAKPAEAEAAQTPAANQKAVKSAAPATPGNPVQAKTVEQKRAANNLVADTLKKVGVDQATIDKLSKPTGNKQISGLGAVRKALIGEGVEVHASHCPAEPDVGYMSDYYEIDSVDVVSDFSKKPISSDDAFMIDGYSVEDSPIGTWDEWLKDLKRNTFEFGAPGYEDALKKCYKIFYPSSSFEDALKELSAEPENAVIEEYAHADTGEPVYELPYMFEIEWEDLGLTTIESELEDLDYDYFESKYEPDWDMMPGGHDDY